MAKQKLTRWFSHKKKPDLPGVYERLNDGGRVRVSPYSYFDGKEWRVSCGSPDDAARQVLGSVFQHLKWRGLAESPNKEPSNDR